MSGALLLGGLLAAQAAAQGVGGVSKIRAANRSYTDEMDEEKRKLIARMRSGDLGFTSGEAQSAREQALAAQSGTLAAQQAEIRQGLASRPSSARDLFLTATAAGEASQRASSQIAQQVAAEESARRAEQLGRLDALRAAEARADAARAEGYGDIGGAVAGAVGLGVGALGPALGTEVMQQRAAARLAKMTAAEALGRGEAATPVPDFLEQDVDNWILDGGTA